MQSLNERNSYTQDKDFEDVLKNLKKEGHLLERFSFENFSMSQILELIKYCPNIKHLTFDRHRALPSACEQFFSRQFPLLETLNIKFQENSGNVLKNIASSNHFPNLVTLHLRGDIPKEDMIAFAASSFFTKLEVLDLSQLNNIDDHLKILAASPNFPNLKSLKLRGNRVSSVGMQALVNSTHFSNLEHLNLEDSRIDLNTLQILASAENFSNLRILNLASNNVTYIQKDFPMTGDPGYFLKMEVLEKVIINPDFYRGIQSLAESSCFPNLEELNLKRNFIKDPSLVGFANSPYFPKLKVLNLAGNEFTKESVSAFAASTYYPHLEQLNLCANKAGDEGCIALANSSNFPKLTFLDLSANEIQLEGALSLAASVHFPLLQMLDLNWLDDDGVKALILSPNFPN